MAGVTEELNYFILINLNLKTDIQFSYWKTLFGTTWVCESFSNINFMKSKWKLNISS